MSNEADKSDTASTPAPAPEAQTAPVAAAESTAPEGTLLDKLAPVLDHAPPEAQEFVRKNGMSVVIGVVVVALVYAGTSAYRNYKASAAAEAEKLLFGQGPEQVQQVVDQYGSTPVAPLAQLTLAASQYDAGQYELAGTQFSQFVQKNPNHPMRAQAELNAAVCLEASGRLDDAMAAFAAFAEKNKDSYLYPEAAFGRARCLEQLGRFAEAKAAYEDFVAGHPDSPWKDRAEASVLYVDKAARAAANPQAAPAGQPFQFNGLNTSAAPAAGLPSPLPTPAPAPAPAQAPGPAPAP